MHRLAGALLAAIVMSACGGDPAGAIFRTTVEGPDGSYAQEVVLGDQTGLVTGIDPSTWDGQGGFDPPIVAIDEHNPNTLIFRWANGACDRPAIAFSGLATGSIFVSTHARSSAPVWRSSWTVPSASISPSRSRPIGSTSAAGVRSSRVTLDNVD
jgi:hypothetical protein